MALFVKGEREYRRGNFLGADSLYGEALARDPGFAWAALRAAQAASWLTKRSDAHRLARQALQRADSLPRRYATLARGLEAYMAGEPARALAEFREARVLDPRWAEAWMAWGEVWFHLLPPVGSPLDSATLAFETARRIDPAFTPPLFHQLQLAAWDDDRTRVDSLARLLDRTGLPPDDQAIADLMQSCVRRSPAAEDWRKAVTRSPVEALSAAHWVSVGGARLWPCAVGGFGAVFRADTGRSVNAFYAQVGLVSLLAARDDAAGAVAVLAEDLFPPNRDQLLVFLWSAGLSLGPLADSAAARLDGRLSGTGLFTAPTAWAAGVGALLRGDTLLARPLAVLDSIATRGDSSRQREARLYRRSLDARKILLRGDTAAAITALTRLVPDGNQDVLRWRPWEALGWERLQLAELLAARRDWRRAMDVAAGFDSPAAIALVPWIPASLLLRERVALELGETARAAGFRARHLSLRGRAGPTPPPGR
jgi:tetratricopeptide (TPR) repeat protein